MADRIARGSGRDVGFQFQFRFGYARQTDELDPITGINSGETITLSNFSRLAVVIMRRESSLISDDSDERDPLEHELSQNQDSLRQFLHSWTSQPTPLVQARRLTMDWSNNGCHAINKYWRELQADAEVLDGFWGSGQS